MTPRYKGYATPTVRLALHRISRIRRELADWPMTDSRRLEKEREIHAIRVTFNL